MNMVNDLSSIYESEDHSKLVFKAPEVPNSYESITVEWLTDVLCGVATSAKVTGFELGARDDGSANRRRMRITYNAAGADAGLPTALFCKSADRLENRQILGPSGVARTEVNFYSKLRPLLDIEAPACYYSRYNPENHAFMIMLADLSDSCELADETSTIDWTRAASQMTLLAQLHARFYESPLLGSDRLPFRSWPATWDGMMAAMPLWKSYADIGFVDSSHLMSGSMSRRRADIWPATQASVEMHRALPRTLTHCDVHLKNWYVTGNDHMGLLDWQIVSVGHWSRDVIYALTTALSIENRRLWERDLVRLYLDRLAHFGGPDVNETDVWPMLRSQILSALAFWTITFRPSPGMPNYHPEERSLEFLKRLYAAIDDHDALSSLTF